MSYVERAEKVIEELYHKDGCKITTTKIRGLLSGISDIYNDVIQLESDELTSDIIKRLQYLKVQFVYESGRDSNVKNFIDKAKLIGVLDKVIQSRSKKNFIVFERYMEALVAYHRFNGGEE